MYSRVCACGAGYTLGSVQLSIVVVIVVVVLQTVDICFKSCKCKTMRLLYESRRFSHTASTDYCLDRFFWATRFL